MVNVHIHDGSSVLVKVVIPAINGHKFGLPDSRWRWRWQITSSKQLAQEQWTNLHLGIVIDVVWVVSGNSINRKCLDANPDVQRISKILCQFPANRSFGRSPTRPAHKMRPWSPSARLGRRHEFFQCIAGISSVEFHIHDHPWLMSGDFWWFLWVNFTQRHLHCPRHGIRRTSGRPTQPTVGQMSTPARWDMVGTMSQHRSLIFRVHDSFYSFYSIPRFGTLSSNFFDSTSS